MDTSRDGMMLMYQSENGNERTTMVLVVEESGPVPTLEKLIPRINPILPNRCPDIAFPVRQQQRRKHVA